MRRILIFICAFFPSELNGLQIHTTFSNRTWFTNSFNGPQKDYFICDVWTDLLDKKSVVTIAAETNTRTIENVNFIRFISNKIKFIPNSVFTIFSNLDLIEIQHNRQFETIDREFFKGATKLRVVYIPSNNISELDGNIFVEAPNLHYINLRNNSITHIHRLAFYGLRNLQGIYLQNNKIKNLYPKIFSKMSELHALYLLNNTCIDKRVIKRDNITAEITNLELMIEKNCSYEMEDDFASKKDLIDLFNTVKQLTGELKLEKEKNIEATASLKENKILIQDLKRVSRVLEKRLRELQDSSQKSFANFQDMITLNKDKMIVTQKNTENFRQEILKVEKDRNDLMDKIRLVQNETKDNFNTCQNRIFTFGNSAKKVSVDYNRRLKALERKTNNLI